MSYCCEICGSTYHSRLMKLFVLHKKIFITLITMIIHLYFFTAQKYLNFMN